MLLKYKNARQNQVLHKSTYNEMKNEYKKEFHALANIYTSLFSSSTAVFWIHKQWKQKQKNTHCLNLSPIFYIQIVDS